MKRSPGDTDSVGEAAKLTVEQAQLEEKLEHVPKESEQYGQKHFARVAIVYNIMHIHRI